MNICINKYTSKVIYDTIVLSASYNNNDNIDNYRTNLDTHTNIVILEKNYYITRDMRRIAEA